MIRDDMALPPGKTCADCIHVERCRKFLSGGVWTPEWTRCDWYPSRFFEKPAPPPPPAEARP